MGNLLQDRHPIENFLRTCSVSHPSFITSLCWGLFHSSIGLDKSPSFWFVFVVVSPTITVGLSSRPSLSLARFSFCFCLIYYPMHCNYIIYIVFYELYSMHCILCIVSNTFYSKYCNPYIVFLALYSLYCIVF